MKLWTRVLTRLNSLESLPLLTFRGHKIISFATESEPQRKTLPEELSGNVVELTCKSTAEGGICHVYLVGTCHISQESCEKVRAVIRYIKPQVVFLELCERRKGLLTNQSHNVKAPTVGEMIKMWKKKQSVFGIAYGSFLAKIGDKLGVVPGSEFRVGFEEGTACGSKVVLGDRPVQITLQRTWAKMPLWYKTKLCFFISLAFCFVPNAKDLKEMVKKMESYDLLTLLIDEMAEHFPTLVETIIHERDQYMTSTLLNQAIKHNSVVAVVGKGHLPGITKYWKQPVPAMHLLEMLPQEPVSSSVKVLKSLGVAVSGAAIIWGIYVACKK